MRIRIVFIVFILIIIVLQFLLPRKKTIIETEINTGTMIKIQETINFLWDDIITAPDSDTINSKEIKDIQQILQENKIPTDFAYLIIYNEKNNLQIIPEEYLEEIIINDKIDERLNNNIMIQLYTNYLKDLYKESKNRKITAIASQIGLEKTKKIV